MSLASAEAETWHYLPEGSYTVEVQVGITKMVKVVRVVRGGGWNKVDFTFPHRPFLPKMMVVFVFICGLSCTALAIAFVCRNSRSINRSPKLSLSKTAGWSKTKNKPSYRGFQPLATKEDNLFIDIDDDEDEVSSLISHLVSIRERISRQ